MRTLLFLGALACGASVAQATGNSFYFGAGVTSNHINHTNQQGYPGPSSGSFDTNSWTFFVGFRPISLFAVEADYIDLGSKTKTQDTPVECVDIGSCAVSKKSDAKAFSGYAVGFLPIPVPLLDVYGKVGLASYRLNDTITYYNIVGAPVSTEYPDNGTAFTWGAGIQAHVGIIGGRLEYEGFDKASTSVFSLSVFLNL